MTPLIFISACSADYQYAEQVYRFLKSHGVATFFSQESLPELASSDYRKQIDEALDVARHMIVVTSSRDNVRSRWVEAEWGLFINEMRSGRKDGNIVTVAVGNLTPADLPASLRYYEVIPFQQQAFPKLLRYVTPVRAEASPQAEPTIKVNEPVSYSPGAAAKPSATQKPGTALARKVIPPRGVDASKAADLGRRNPARRLFYGAVIGAAVGGTHGLLAGFYEVARYGSHLSPVIPSITGAFLGALFGIIVVWDRWGRISGISVGLIGAIIGAVYEGPSAAVGMGLMYGTIAAVVAMVVAFVIKFIARKI